MLFEDFCRFYNMIYVCIHFPASWSTESIKGRWNAASNRFLIHKTTIMYTHTHTHTHTHTRTHTHTHTASNSGGCPDKKNEWWLNPCYKISVQTRTQIFISMSQVSGALCVFARGCLFLSLSRARARALSLSLCGGEETRLGSQECQRVNTREWH